MSSNISRAYIEKKTNIAQRCTRPPFVSTCLRIRPTMTKSRAQARRQSGDVQRSRSLKLALSQVKIWSRKVSILSGLSHRNTIGKRHIIFYISGQNNGTCQSGRQEQSSNIDSEYYGFGSMRQKPDHSGHSAKLSGRVDPRTS